MPARLSMSSLRVDVAGVPAIDGLTLASTGEWVLVLAAPRALVDAALGRRVPVRGEVQLEGLAPAEALARGVAAGAILDGPLPARWTALEYVTWSARLAGHSRSAAEVLALDALTRLELDAGARARLGGASIAIRRAVVVAAALATGAATLLLEDPTVDLPVDVGRSLARGVVRALAGRRVVAFAARASLDSPFGLAADEAIVVDGSRVALQGAPAELAANERAVTLRVAGSAAAFTAACVAAGAAVLAGPDAAAETQLTLDLGGLKALDVVRLALDCGATILELRPLASAFA